MERVQRAKLEEGGAYEPGKLVQSRVYGAVASATQA